MNNNAFKSTIIITSLLCLSSCGISKQECLSAYNNGLSLGKNGSNGMNQTTFMKKYRSCLTSYKVKLNYAAYMHSWEAGRNEYCSPQHAKQLGINNNTNLAICHQPKNIWSQFTPSYKKGLQKYWTLKGKSDCLKGLDKQTKNYTDAQKLYATKDVTFNPQPDYQNGYQEGIPLYCTQAKGLSVGSSGIPNNNICQSYGNYNNALAFNTGYQKGLRIYCVPQTINNLAFENKPYPSVCPSNDRLHHAYSRGFQRLKQYRYYEQKLKETNNSIEDDNRTISDNNKSIDSLRSSINDKTNYLSTLGSKDQQQIYALQDQIQSLQNQIEKYYEDNQRQQEDLSTLEKDKLHYQDAAYNVSHHS